MLSKRLIAIADLVDKNSKVVDIGSDHAYIPIFLIKTKITNNVLATDVSQNVLRGTKENIKNNGLDIPTLLSDGFSNIKEKFDIAILSGMGTTTIIKILSNGNDKIPETLIIQSNNDLDKLRLFMNKLGYKIVLEKVVFDKKYYDIIKYKKGQEILLEEEILFGKSKNKEYFIYLKNRYDELFFKSKNKQYENYVSTLNKIIEKIPVD